MAQGDESTTAEKGKLFLWLKLETDQWEHWKKCIISSVVL